MNYEHHTLHSLIKKKQTLDRGRDDPSQETYRLQSSGIEYPRDKQESSKIFGINHNSLIFSCFIVSNVAFSLRVVQNITHIKVLLVSSKMCETQTLLPLYLSVYQNHSGPT